MILRGGFHQPGEFQNFGLGCADEESYKVFHFNLIQNKGQRQCLINQRPG